jgi:hypothetical protein
MNLTLRSFFRNILSDRIIAYIEYFISHFKPESYYGFTGPLNGQVYRQRLVLSLFEKIKFDNVIETGTHRGGTTEFFYNNFKLPIYSVELHDRYYFFSKLRFRKINCIQIQNEPSIKFLNCLAKDSDISKSKSFFYLDAHSRESLPLACELRIIFDNWMRPVVMIDDFEVIDDPGYRYDNYGIGKVLNMDYLNQLQFSNLDKYFPSTPSNMRLEINEDV